MRPARLVLLTVALGAVECDTGPAHDLPAGWAGARELPVDQSACEAGGGVAPAGELMLMRGMGRLRASYLGAQFRCQQRVCAYRLDGVGQVRVLVQPCEMDPTEVPRCDCLYRVGFDLTGVETGNSVELHRRWDRYGATSEPAPVLVDSERAP